MNSDDYTHHEDDGYEEDDDQYEEGDTGGSSSPTGSQNRMDFVFLRLSHRVVQLWGHRQGVLMEEAS